MNILKRGFMLAALLLVSTFSLAQNTSLDSGIIKLMADNHIPGLAACAIDSGKMTWAGYYGYQDILKKIPVTESTLFAVASTSKTITSAALMQLYGEGRFKMDDDVNKFLPFRVANPSYINTPITFGELLRHRSSIKDNGDYLGQFWDVNHGDPTIPLARFLKDYLSPDGKNYDVKKNFYQEKPDSAFHYCNVGIALVGYLVERISGMPFDQFCKQRLFIPLEMNHTAWFLKDLDSNRVAMPTAYSDSLKRYLNLGYGGYPDYPAGELRTSISDFAHFLIAWTQNGNFKGKQVFKNSVIQKLTPVDYDLGFYTWFLFATDKGRILYMHTGGDNGVLTFIGFSPSTKRGIIILMNGVIDNNEQFKKLINTIYDNAR
jgi:CubicO group peptidase (beta-lactamase class C family)